LQNNPDIVVIVTFIKRFDYQNIQGTAAVAVQLREWIEDEQLPLVAKRPACNVAMFCNSVANEPIDSWYTTSKLYRNACNEFPSMANVSTAS
jgi:hypothetical protein